MSFTCKKNYKKVSKYQLKCAEVNLVQNINKIKEMK